MTPEQFLKLIDATPRPPSRDAVIALIDDFYLVPGNEVGGALHIVLDDGNVSRKSIEWCREYARSERDHVGVAMATFLLSLTDEQLDWLEFVWEADDALDEFLGFNGEVEGDE